MNTTNTQRIERTYVPQNKWAGLEVAAIRAYSEDGGETWRKMDGTPLALDICQEYDIPCNEHRQGTICRDRA